MTYYGNNTLLGGAGNDYLRALDPKHDTYASYEAGLNYLDGGAGHDTIQGGTGDDTIYGGDGNDWIFTSSGNDYVDGGKGNDLLEAGPGNKTLLGGNGNDFCHGYESGCFMDGGAGNDLLSGVASTLLGGNDNDTLNGYEGVTMTGGAGYDVFELCSSWGPDDYTDNGTQIVTDYTAGEDKIMVSGGFLDSTETEVSGNDVIIHATWSQDGDVSISALNIKNGKGKAITFVNEKGKTIETKTFTANSSGLFAEDNFVTADDLSAITENNLSSVSEIETQNFDTLTHENLITYAK